MRTMLFALSLALAPAAQAGPINSLFTLAGAFAGGAGGALIGAPVYGAIDPYGSDDGAEWVVIGVPMGFGIGAAAGGTLGHVLSGGPKGGRVLLFSGVVAAGGTALLAATPGLYADFADDRFALAYVGGVALSVVGVPLTATLTSLFLFKGDEQAAAWHVAPAVGPRRAGLVVSRRF